MSYRLIDSNAIAVKYPEVNNMPCIFVDLPNGLDGQHYDLRKDYRPTGEWIKIGEITDSKGVKKHVLNCSECGALHRVRKLWAGEYVNAEYCPNCGSDMRDAERREP